MSARATCAALTRRHLDTTLAIVDAQEHGDAAAHDAAMAEWSSVEQAMREFWEGIDRLAHERDEAQRLLYAAQREAAEVLAELLRYRLTHSSRPPPPEAT